MLEPSLTRARGCPPRRVGRREEPSRDAGSAGPRTWWWSRRGAFPDAVPALASTARPRRSPMRSRWLTVGVLTLALATPTTVAAQWSARWNAHPAAAAVARPAAPAAAHPAPGR